MPHIIAILHVPMALGLGLLLGNAGAWWLAGGALALATDPIALVVSILIGAVLPRWWQVLLGVLVASAAIHLLVIAMNGLADASGLALLLRASGMATVAFASSFARLCFGAEARRNAEPA